MITASVGVRLRWGAAAGRAGAPPGGRSGRREGGRMAVRTNPAHAVESVPQPASRTTAPPIAPSALARLSEARFNAPISVGASGA